MREDSHLCPTYAGPVHTAGTHTHAQMYTENKNNPLVSAHEERGDMSESSRVIHRTLNFKTAANFCLGRAGK